MTDTAVAHSGTTLSTPDIVKAMLAAGPGVSDLIFSPGRAAQVEKHGELVSVALPDTPFLRPEDTHRIAQDLIGSNEQATRGSDREWKLSTRSFLSAERDSVSDPSAPRASRRRAGSG